MKQWFKTGLRGHEKPWLAFDIDDSACDFAGMCYERLNKHFGTNHTFDPDGRYWMMEQFGLERDEWNRVCLQLELLDDLIPHPNLPRNLLVLSKYFRIQFVTARGFVPGAREITTRWLEKNHFPIDSLMITQPGADKSEALKHCELYVEDHPTTALKVAASGKAKEIWLVDRPWNQKVEHDLIERVQSSELAERLLDSFFPS